MLFFRFIFYLSYLLVCSISGRSVRNDITGNLSYGSGGDIYHLGLGLGLGPGLGLGLWGRAGRTDGPAGRAGRRAGRAPAWVWDWVAWLSGANLGSSGNLYICHHHLGSGITSGDLGLAGHLDRD